MEIKRKIEGKDVVIELSTKELNEIYQTQRRLLDITEVKENLENMGPSTVLSACHFPYPAFYYMDDTKKENAMCAILENDELMLSIYQLFEEYYEDSSYAESMRDAWNDILYEFGKNNPNFLDQFETIDVIAYKKYQAHWFKRQHYSDGYIAQIKTEYEEYKKHNQDCSITEYIDYFGFHGSLYVCFEEFLNHEYLDVVYMNSLLSAEEYHEYLVENYTYIWKDIVLVNEAIHAEVFPISGMMDGEFYQIDEYLEAVVSKYGDEDVKTYMMDDIHFDPSELPFGAESCGCYKNGELQFQNPEYSLRDQIKIIEAIELPCGLIQDADTVLYDLFEESINDKFNGIATDIFNIWKNSSDKKSIEHMFYEFTGCEFDDFLQKCLHTMHAAQMSYIFRDWLKEKAIKDDIDTSWLTDNFVEILENWGNISVDCKEKLLRELIDAAEDYLRNCHATIHSEAIIRGQDYNDLFNRFSKILGIK